MATPIPPTTTAVKMTLRTVKSLERNWPRLELVGAELAQATAIIEKALATAPVL